MTIWQLDCIESLGSLAALIALTSRLSWQLDTLDSLTTMTVWLPWQLECLDSLIALTAWLPWQLDCLDSSIALTARLLWQLDFLDSLNVFKLDCWNSLMSLQYVSWMDMPVCRDAIASKNHSFYTQPIPIVLPKILHCHCQPTSISYLCLCILQNVRIHIIFISSVSNTHSRLQLSCCLVCRVSSVSGLIQKWIEGNLQTKCTHSEYQLPTHMTTVPSTPATTHNTDERTTKVYIVFHSKNGAINVRQEKRHNKTLLCICDYILWK